MKNEIFTIPGSKGRDGVFANVLSFESWLHSVSQRETGLHDLGLAIYYERQEGREVSEKDRVWMAELMYESLRKMRYLIVRDLYEFIPERITKAHLFKTVTR